MVHSLLQLAVLMKRSKDKGQKGTVLINIQKYILLTCVFALLILPLSPAFSESAPVRIKDIAHVLEARDNQLMGFGLVIGLKNTGDSTQTEYTKQALTNLLSRMGIAPQDKEFKSKNIAAVMVTAKLPAFVNVGQKIDVAVSSLGDATTLQGGTLLMTPLQGADDNVYAVAQGQLTLGFAAGEVPEKKPTNVGYVVNGGIVERDVPVSISEDFVSIVLDKPDYTTASRIVGAMRDANIYARARDAATIVASREPAMDMVKFLSIIENLTVVPDTVARIVINEQTGVVVMGENVSIAPISVSYNDVNVTISASAAKLTDLISALNAVGVRPKDLIAILRAIKAAGAISADIEAI